MEYCIRFFLHLFKRKKVKFTYKINFINGLVKKITKIKDFFQKFLISENLEILQTRKFAPLA